MHCRVTILTILAAQEQVAGNAFAIIHADAGMVARHMALLTELRRTLLEQGSMVRAVRVVAVAAIFRDRGVFP